ncbi:alpha-glucuronidase [Pseudoduganella lurida]|uniref:Xylan alpha-1,2-glucuronidase n=1 Tax=Pseudoduganella lurida TaxID=1036180 RepID=A0A562RFS9_9BURK|nr:alpha-glucuronidase family glycosyl hydrolase [Pseudoduganella lurida]TWI67424.1 alpha-glucuronidase [Pseudoduganella lurida]
MRFFTRLLLSVLFCTCASAGAAPASEDGYDLWLRYRALPAAEAARLAPHARAIVAPATTSPMLDAAIGELQRGVGGWLGTAPARTDEVRAGAIVLAMPATRGATAAWFDGLGQEGYRVLRTRLEGQSVTVIAANTDRGLLYGSFAYLRGIATDGAQKAPDLRSTPRLPLRLLNHWDDLNRHVERGYAGASIWHWWNLPDILDQRYTDYARANASLGINGAVLNNVNAKPDILTAPFIAKAAALANVLRPYGIKVYLSVRWSTPLELKATATADPLDPAVAAWWRAKSDELYAAIPDFGGFLVKANSEGQPGPHDYHRSHAEGANMLARAVAPHGGIVMWRAFVYSEDKPTDRARQAFDQFTPLDGQFDKNVIVQVKNGPIDFQPREPVHPLFGAMPRTPLLMEFQITKEYLGFSTHLAYLGTMFEETLRTDLRPGIGAGGQAATVTRVLDGTLDHGQATGMAGVANIGTDRNWSGSHFDQANWYVFGRLAWNPEAGAEAIAREWAAQTFSRAPRVVDTVSAMMMASREAVVDYMTPLGLHHVMGTGHHHGPAPWVDNLARPDWNPVYYHRADKAGIGFDRTAHGKGGSGSAGQYAPALARLYEDPASTPENLLLWFHHLPWTYTTRSGRPLWDELVHRYDAGVTAVAAMQKQWDSLAPYIDPQRHADTAQRLKVQHREALWWRDASIAYFQSINGLPLPAGARAPAQSLDDYKALKFPYPPGNG